ncbi:MAG: transporter [Isosphaeraceae bacterium]
MKRDTGTGPSATVRSPVSSPGVYPDLFALAGTTDSSVKLAADPDDGGEGEKVGPEASGPPASEASEEYPDAPPPFLLSGLRRWMQEDDPDGSGEGEDYENRMKPRSDPAINIRHPDPDTANFPNSAFTIPQGRVYIETSPIAFYGNSVSSPRVYNWEFLFRYGITDRLEFRLFSNGLTNEYSSVRHPKNSPLSENNSEPTIGFSPLIFDLKYHLWDEHKRSLLPAVGIEVYIETTLGSRAFNQGTQPSINLLFDHSLPLGFQFEWNVGIAGNVTAQGSIFYDLAFQWALQHELFSEDLIVFTHGYLNNAALPRISQDVFPGGSDVLVSGIGAQYALSDRLAIFGSYNWGLTPGSPGYLALMGVAFAL